MNVFQRPLATSIIFDCLPLIIKECLDNEPITVHVFYSGNSILYETYNAFNQELTIDIATPLVAHFTEIGKVLNGEVVEVFEIEEVKIALTSDYSATSNLKFKAITGPLSDMVLIQRPNIVSFAADAKDLLINSSVDVDVVIEVDNVELLSEIYDPFANTVKIDISSLLKDFFETTIPDSASYVQPKQNGLVLVKWKKLTDEEYTHQYLFNCIAGGIGQQISWESHIRKEFLTNQPQINYVSKKTPLFLSFFREQYSIEKMTIHAWFNKDDYDETIITIPYFIGEKGKIHTEQFSIEKIKQLTGSAGDYIGFDVYLKKTINTDVPGVELELSSKPQRFIFNLADDVDNEVFYFENTQGSIEMVQFNGQSSHSLDHEIDVAKIEKNIQDYMTDYSVVYTKNTGYFRNKISRKQAEEFLVSPRRWIYDTVKNEFKKIFLSSYDAKIQELSLNSFEFKWSYADDDKYKLEEKVGILPDTI